MTVTGFTVEGKSGEKNHICPDCAETVGIEADGRRVKEITDSQYRHGNGGGACLFCGFDTLDILSNRAVEGETPRDRVKTGDRPNGLGPYADVFDAAEIAGMVFITASDTERVEIAPGVTKVDHAEMADEVLHVELPRDDGDREADGETVVDLLEQAGFEAEYVADVHGDGYCDSVQAGLRLD